MVVFASRHETLNIVLLPHLLAAISQTFVQLSGKIKCDQERSVYIHLKKKNGPGFTADIPAIVLKSKLRGKR